MEEGSILLQLKNVARQAGVTQVPNSAHFDPHAGEFRPITGQSGCGKSTLPEIVASLVSPAGNEILLEGKGTSTLKPETYRQQVSYYTRTPTLFGDAIYDNLIFPWQIRNRSSDPDVFLTDLARFELPKTILRKNINELSDGEKQRVSLTRNLQLLPKTLLLDEIISALDEANECNVNELIHHYVRGKNTAVLQVTHDKDEVEHTDNVVTLQPHTSEVQGVSSERA